MRGVGGEVARGRVRKRMECRMEEGRDGKFCSQQNMEPKKFRI